MSGRNHLIRFLNLCEESGLGNLRRQFFATSVRWCNGSTELFGGFSHGSNPCRTTTFPQQNEVSVDSRTNPAQIGQELVEPKMRFPKTIPYYEAEVKIYGKKKNYPFYRIVYRMAGKRKMEHFAKYSDAKKAAEKKAEEIHNGSVASALTVNQSRDALAAFERLETLRHAIGRRVSLLAAVSEFADASTKLKGRHLSEVIEAYLKSIAHVQQKDISEAVEDFILMRKPLTESKEGKRAQLSKNYAYMVGLWLRDFASTFSATSVCDLTKEHMNTFMQKHSSHSPKSRNHYRGAVKMFLSWCVKRDYLTTTHRLLEADSLKTETADTSELDFYRPEELQAMLNRAANKPVPKSQDLSELLPLVALGGLAGLRLEEILRLEWSDVWRVKGHIEITAQKAKTRSRRLVEICPALAAWLAPYSKKTGKVFCKSHDTFHELFVNLRESTKLPRKIPARRNGLRHAFCTYHYALHANENLTSQQAGNSPAMIHQHYKGLATKNEAEKWFAVMPHKSS